MYPDPVFQYFIDQLGGLILIFDFHIENGKQLMSSSARREENYSHVPKLIIIAHVSVNFIDAFLWTGAWSIPTLTFPKSDQKFQITFYDYMFDTSTDTTCQQNESDPVSHKQSFET